VTVATAHVFETEQALVDHAAFENAVEHPPALDALYSEAARKAAALDFLFFLEDANAMTWAQIRDQVAHYNRR
jgi:hypothetical protein